MIFTRCWANPATLQAVYKECSYYKLPEQVIEQLERVERIPEAARIVLSFCHIQDTQDNVKWSCCPQSQFSRVVITRKPDGPKGKLEFLKRYIKALPVKVLHMDGSFEVLTEFQNHISNNHQTNILVAGIAEPGKRRVDQVTYFRNIKEVVAQVARSPRYRHLGI